MSRDIFAYKLNLTGWKFQTLDIKSKQHKTKDFYLRVDDLKLREKLREKNE